MILSVDTLDFGIATHSTVFMKPVKGINLLTVVLNSKEVKNSFIFGDKLLWNIKRVQVLKQKLQNNLEELLFDEQNTISVIFYVDGETSLNVDKHKITFCMV